MTTTTLAGPAVARPAPPTGLGSLFSGLNITFTRHELGRRLNRQTLLVTLLLPAVLYLALYRTGGANSDTALPHGNFAAWMMIGIALYGAATASTSSAASISVERSVGWMRTIRMSPVTPTSYVLVKLLCSVVVASLPVVVVGALGSITGVRADTDVWVLGLVTAWLGSAIFAALGLVLGLTLRTEVVMHMPGLTMTALAFLGDLFIPLSGTMREVSQYSPMYGVATLARWRLTEGVTFSGEHSDLAIAAANAGAWFTVFTIFAVLRFRRSTGRQ